MITKEIFIESIEAIQKQMEYDIKISESLGEVFPNAHAANLLPDNHFLHNALLGLLQHCMDDERPSTTGQSWIEYFCYELDFGKENWRLKAHDENGKEIKLTNSAELWDYLKKNNAP